MNVLTKTMAVALVAGTLLTLTAVTVSAEGGRLNRLLMNRTNVFLPHQLVLGQPNRFVFKTQPNYKVRLYMSPLPKGLSLPDGTALRVGKDVEVFDAVANEKGVAQVVVPIPNEEGWAGETLYIDAITWAATASTSPDDTTEAKASDDDMIDVQLVQLMDSTGRRTSKNTLVLAKPAERGNTSVMPALPGISPQMMQQVNNLSLRGSVDERRQELMDYTGERNSDAQSDRNSFINPTTGKLELQ